MNGLNAAGPLFMIAIHLLVPMTLMRNPKDFAEKARRTPRNAAFKEDSSPRRMWGFVLNSITQRCRPTSAVSIWDAADVEEEDHITPGPSSRRRWHARGRSETRPPLPSAWEDQEPAADDEQDEEALLRRSGPGSRKRRRSLTPPSSQEVFTQRNPLPGPSGSKWKRSGQPLRFSTPLSKGRASGKRPLKKTSPNPPPASSSSSSSSSEDEAPDEQTACKIPGR